MTYKETLDFLFSSLPVYQRVGEAAYKADLSTTIQLDKHLEYPHKYFKSIHIAGTNGKGSVSHILASILSEAGYRTGLYTSPHLRDFRERIKIDGRKIDEAYVVDFVEGNKDIISELKPSFFEMTVAMAFRYFKDMEVDVAVIETGMGGRLDSTNILTPLISIITNISLDHTRFLGSSKKAIAKEKAGIIKKNVPVVIGRTDPDTDEVFRETAKKMACKLTFAPYDFKVRKIKRTDDGKMLFDLLSGDELVYKSISSGLSGAYQTENIATAFSSIEVLKRHFDIPEDSVLNGLADVVENTGIEGRWQLIGRDPLVICDTAHNQEGLERVLEDIQAISAKEIRFILGFTNDKNVSELLRLFPLKAIYYFTEASIPRSMSLDILAKKATEANLSYRIFKDVKEAYKEAKRDCISGDTIYIGGSTFVVADFLELID